MVDTPGLLDRPMLERNQIEMQAIAALEHLGDVLLFLIDWTDEATTPISEQERLLGEVRGLLSDRRVLVVSTKLDLLEGDVGEEDHRISSISGEGLEELRADLIEIIDADRVDDPLTLPEHWPREDERYRTRSYMP
jgi:nucleolar GTP-binding protein